MRISFVAISAVAITLMLAYSFFPVSPHASASDSVGVLKVRDPYMSTVGTTFPNSTPTAGNGTVGTTFPTSTPTAGKGTSSNIYLIVDGVLIAFIGVMAGLILIRNWRSRV